MFAVLCVAVVAISFAPILVKGIDDADPRVIALWRTTLVAVLLAPSIRRVAAADLVRIAVAGLCLGAHFSVWFASIHLTTVMRSTVLVCTGPVWVGLIEWALHRRAPALRYWLGMGVALAGVALMVSTQPTRGEASLLGDVLAAIGALLVAVYLVLGREVRQRVGIGAYGSLVCAAAAIGLVPAIALAGAPFVGFSWASAGLIVLLAAGPQLLGHNGFGYALRYLPASVVSSTTLLEPVGATLLAIPIFGELPAPVAATGAAVSVAGVALATLRPRRAAS